MPLDVEVGLSPGDFVFDWGPVPPPQKGAESPLQFSAHVYCGQTAGWIRMAHGMQVGGRPQPRRLCSMGTQLPQKRAHPLPPNFWPMSVVAKRLDGRRRHLVRK